MQLAGHHFSDTNIGLDVFQTEGGLGDGVHVNDYAQVQDSFMYAIVHALDQTHIALSFSFSALHCSAMTEKHLLENNTKECHGWFATQRPKQTTRKSSFAIVASQDPRSAVHPGWLGRQVRHTTQTHSSDASMQLRQPAHSHLQRWREDEEGNKQAV